MTGDTRTRALADGRPGYRLIRREDFAFTDPYPGRGSGFSPEAPEGVRFLIRSRLLTDDELKAFNLT